MRPLSYARAVGVDSAVATVAADPDSAFLAGGTTEVDLIRLGVTRPRLLVDINALPLADVEDVHGGLRVGALARMTDVARDPRVVERYPAVAQALLLGASPGDITGAPEGAALGAAAGLGCWLARREAQAGGFGRGVALAALTGGGAGLLIPLLGGRLFGGSLDLLARHVPASRLRLDPIGALLGEPDFGRLSQTVAGGLEGALFAGCIAAAYYDNGASNYGLTCVSTTTPTLCGGAPGTVEVGVLPDLYYSYFDKNLAEQYNAPTYGTVWDIPTKTAIAGATVTVDEGGNAQVVYAEPGAGGLTTHDGPTGASGFFMVYAKGAVAITVSAPGHASEHYIVAGTPQDNPNVIAALPKM